MFKFRDSVAAAAMAGAVWLAGGPARAESDAASAPDASQASGAYKTELVRERYSGRMMKLERNVTQDENLNFVNHGPWTMWNPAGSIIAKGEYLLGKRHGDWKRFHFDAIETRAGAAPADDAGEAPLGAEFDGFQRPLVSEARFVDDRIVGLWTVSDADGNKVFSVEVDHGALSGKATWWHTRRQKAREIDFRKGVVDGEWREWDAAGRETRNDHYIEGCRLAEAVTRFDNGEKSSEGAYLYAKENLRIDSDWWAGRLHLTVAGVEGKTLKQGKWTFWYENGEKRCEAEYLDDLPVGWHTWWHTNGQKECEGGYADGRAHGQWTFWHENGLRATQGEYVQGTKVGRWVRWNADGKVAENKDQGRPAPGTIPTVPVSLPAADSNGRPVPPSTTAAQASATATPAARMVTNCLNCRPRR